MRYVGSCDDIVGKSIFWGMGPGYLVGEYLSRDEMIDIYEYQQTRFYMDEVKNENT